MSEDLMSLNKSKATTVLTCRVDVALKGKFTLLAAERGMNVNQLLSTIVEEAVSKKNEERLVKITKEHEKIQKQFTDLQNQLSKLQTDNLMESQKVGALEESNRKVSDELLAQTAELNKSKQDLQTLQNNYKKALENNQGWNSAYETLKKQLEISTQQFKESQQIVRVLTIQQNELLNKNKQVLEKLKEREKKADINIRSWVWEIVNEFPTEITQVAIP